MTLNQENEPPLVKDVKGIAISRFGIHRRIIGGCLLQGHNCEKKAPRHDVDDNNVRSRILGYWRDCIYKKMAFDPNFYIGSGDWHIFNNVLGR